MQARNAFLLLVLATPFAAAQDGRPAADSASERFQGAAESVQQDLRQSLDELARLREQIKDQKIPLSRRLSELEQELVQVRLDYQQTSRLLDARTLDLGNLRSRIQERKNEGAYLSNLLGEYGRNFESRLHITELQRYETSLQTAKLAPEDGALSEREVFRAQVGLLFTALDRAEDALGGTRFEGTAVDQGGLVHKGNFVLVGPAAIFRSADGHVTGAAEQRLGSLEPAIVPFQNPLDVEAGSQVVFAGNGAFPLDPTLGSAHKVEAIDEGFVAHVKKGGPVMIPIFVLAAAALLVALYKWLTLAFVRSPSARQIDALLQAVARRDKAAAVQAAGAIRGPTGRMLTAGVEHLDEPRELVEEVMYERVLSTKLRLQSLLPFVAITASAAPLFGLLGTVTGIMNTFSLITVFGTGDVKTLSSGISEALITTEFGLYVAIPSLLLYAFLSRKARALVDGMEKTAVAFLNQVGKTPFHVEARAPRQAPDERRDDGHRGHSERGPSREEVREILTDLLVPFVQTNLQRAGLRGQRTNHPDAPEDLAGVAPAARD